MNILWAVNECSKITVWVSLLGTKMISSVFIFWTRKYVEYPRSPKIMVSWDVENFRILLITEHNISLFLMSQPRTAKIENTAVSKIAEYRTFQDLNNLEYLEDPGISKIPEPCSRNP